MDNPVFNVNGSGVEALALTLEVAFKQRDKKPCAFRRDDKRGLVLYWYADKGKDAPTPLLGQPTAQQLAVLILQELEGDWANNIPCKDWDADADHDGDNKLGWRVYCDDWGHVGDDSSALIAVRPAYLWFGK